MGLAPTRKRRLCLAHTHARHEGAAVAEEPFQNRREQTQTMRGFRSPQLVEQRLRVLQIGSIEPLRKPAVDGRE